MLHSCSLCLYSTPRCYTIVPSAYIGHQDVTQLFPLPIQYTKMLHSCSLCLYSTPRCYTVVPSACQPFHNYFTQLFPKVEYCCSSAFLQWCYTVFFSVFSSKRKTISSFSLFFLVFDLFLIIIFKPYRPPSVIIFVRITSYTNYRYTVHIHYTVQYTPRIYIFVSYRYLMYLHNSTL